MKIGCIDDINKKKQKKDVNEVDIESLITRLYYSFEMSK